MLALLHCLREDQNKRFISAHHADIYSFNLDRLLLSFNDTPPISGDETLIPNSLLDRPRKKDNRMLPGGRVQSTMAF